MSDVKNEFYDTAAVIINTLKGEQNPQWKRQQMYKDLLPEKVLKMPVDYHYHHIESLVGIYERIKDIHDEGAQQARRQIITDVAASLSFIDKYRDGMRKLNEELDLHGSADLKRLDDLVEKAWKAAKPCLPG